MKLTISLRQNLLPLFTSLKLFPPVLARALQWDEICREGIRHQPPPIVKPVYNNRHHQCDFEYEGMGSDSPTYFNSILDVEAHISVYDLLWNIQAWAWWIWGVSPFLWHKCLLLARLIATSGDELTLGADAATRDVINIPSKYIQHYFTLYIF